MVWYKEATFAGRVYTAVFTRPANVASSYCTGNSREYFPDFRGISQECQSTVNLQTLVRCIPISKVKTNYYVDCSTLGDSR